ncbi:MAG: PilZ domain-containing protein [Bdellovibrionales bacterium]|nr:PilZ domain-containing protein [Bdellovibrionales bacterium]
MNFRVLMIGKRNGETISIRNSLDREDRYQVEIATTAKTAIQRITTQKMNLVLFNLDTFTKDKIRLASDLRELGYGFPVLVLSQIVAPDTFDQVSRMYQTVLLEKPFEDRDLVGLADKLVLGRPVQQRVYRRFYTNQTTNVSFVTGDESKAKIYNLSRGGAYFEAPGLEVEKGDIIKVSVPLREVHRLYNLDARVVWKTKKGMWSGQPGAGIEFLSGSDVYRGLLKRL